MCRSRHKYLILLLLCACDPFHTGFAPVQPAVMYRARTLSPAPPAGSDVLVMTWNIKFAGGRLRFFFECGGDESLMTEAEVRAHLRPISAAINAWAPDILLLQEIDIESKRCAYVDLVQELLDSTHLNYGAYASQWRADFVPSDGIGRVDSGNAVLSRWPIAEAERLALPLIEDEDALTRYFYLRRNLLRLRTAPRPDAQLWVVNTHLEAFSNDGTKRRQILRLHAELRRLDDAGERFVAGGDLNSIPPGSPQSHDFPDDTCDDARFEGDDYRGEEAWLDELFRDFQADVDTPTFTSDPEPHFTFSGDERFFWNRKIDHLFTNAAFVPGSALTHQDSARGGVDTLLLSDHAPVSVRVALP